METLWPIFHELEGDSTKNTKNTGKNGEKSQRGTLKNKSNHTSTRLTNTQDPHGYMNNQREIGYMIEFISNP